MMFFKGYLPRKILSHRLIGKTQQTGLMVDFRVRWKKRPGEPKHPRSSYYTNTQLRLLAPELLAEYYKGLFLEDLQRRKKAAAAVKGSEAVKMKDAKAEKPKKTRKKYGMIVQEEENSQPTSKNLPKVANNQPSEVVHEAPNLQPGPPNNNIGISSASVEVLRDNKPPQKFTTSSSAALNKRDQDQLKKGKTKEGKKQKADKLQRAAAEKNQVDLTKFTSAGPTDGTLNSYFAVKPANKTTIIDEKSEKEEIYCED